VPPPRTAARAGSERARSLSSVRAFVMDVEHERTLGALEDQTRCAGSRPARSRSADVRDDPVPSYPFRSIAGHRRRARSVALVHTAPGSTARGSAARRFRCGGRDDASSRCVGPPSCSAQARAVDRFDDRDHSKVIWTWKASPVAPLPWLPVWPRAFRSRLQAAPMASVPLRRCAGALRGGRLGADVVPLGRG